MFITEKKQSNNSGAALVITMLLVTAVSTVIFAMARSSVAEIRQISRLEDSELAFQAAESGIEAGLLLYRYNHNAEVPIGVSGGMDQSIDKAMRVNVSAGKLESASLEINSNLLSIKKDQQYYDLRLWHKNSNENGISREIVNSQPCQKITDASGKEVYPDYCVADNPNEVAGTESIPALAKDGSVEYDLDNTTSKVYLKWKYFDLGHYPTQNEQEKMRLEYTAYDDKQNMVGKDLFFYDDSKRSQTLSNGLRLNNNSAIDQLKIHNWGGDLNNYQLTLVGPGAKLDSRYTYIESTGYFASAKRKITVKIDRQTGAIFNSYDFVLMSPESITGQ